MPHSWIQAAFNGHRARLGWRIALLILLVAISYLALSPAPPKGLGSSWDKLNHAIAFASLAFCGHWSLRSGRARWLVLPLTLLAYGGAIELLQLQTPGRAGEWADMVGDAVGITIGMLAARAVVFMQVSQN